MKRRDFLKGIAGAVGGGLVLAVPHFKPPKPNLMDKPSEFPYEVQGDNDVSFSNPEMIPVKVTSDNGFKLLSVPKCRYLRIAFKEMPNNQTFFIEGANREFMFLSTQDYIDFGQVL